MASSYPCNGGNMCPIAIWSWSIHSYYFVWFWLLLPTSLAWCSEIGSLTSLHACNSGASSDVGEPSLLHWAVYARPVILFPILTPYSLRRLLSRLLHPVCFFVRANFSPNGRTKAASPQNLKFEVFQSGIKNVMVPGLQGGWYRLIFSRSCKSQGGGAILLHDRPERQWYDRSRCGQTSYAAAH